MRQGLLRLVEPPPEAPEWPEALAPVPATTPGRRGEAAHAMAIFLAARASGRVARPSFQRNGVLHCHNGDGDGDGDGDLLVLDGPKHVTMSGTIPWDATVSAAPSCEACAAAWTASDRRAKKCPQNRDVVHKTGTWDTSREVPAPCEKRWSHAVFDTAQTRCSASSGLSTA